MTAPLLIVNADDFGLTTGVSRSILRAGDAGIVTSTSAMANGAALSACAPALRDSALGVGAHLTLVGEQGPVLSARETPTLVDAHGRLAPGWRPFLVRCALRRIDRDDVRREFGAQIERLRSSGLTITHLDTHQNLHLWPSIAQAMIDVAHAHDIAAIRVTRSAGRSPLALAVRAFAARLETRANKAAMRFPAATAGFDEAGRLDRARLCSAIERLGRLAVTSAELVTHPSQDGDAELEALGWNYRGHDELDALVSADARRAVERAGFRLGTFADLGPAHTARPQTSR
jgi:chitin disaccharide deacetylase